MSIQWDRLSQYATPVILSVMVTLLVLQGAVQNDRLRALDARVAANTERLLMGQADRYTGTMAAQDRLVVASRLQELRDKMDAMEARLNTVERRK